MVLYPMSYFRLTSPGGEKQLTLISRRGDSRLAHPFKGGIASPIPQVPKGRLSHSRAILCPEQTVRIGADVGHWGIRPSLRDLCEGSFEPSSELLGYSRISLRETKAANRSKLPSSRRDGKKCFHPLWNYSTETSEEPVFLNPP